MLPLYEAKMIHHYDTRWATYEPDGTTRLMTEDEKAQHLPPVPRYWVHEAEVDKKLVGWPNSWLLGWRDITNNTNERTMISTVFARAAVGNQMPLAMPKSGLSATALLQSALSSFALDFVARQKAGGSHLNFFTVMQLPAPLPDAAVDGLVLDNPRSWLPSRVEWLNAWITDPTARAVARAELDAYCLHLYGVSRDDADYILETFPIVKRKDLAEFGEYRTKRLIL